MSRAANVESQIHESLHAALFRVVQETVNVHERRINARNSGLSVGQTICNPLNFPDLSVRSQSATRS
jgi:signal transduction histidine kinase